MSRFQKFRGALRGFLKLRFARFYFIDYFELIRGKRFCELVFFTGPWPGRFRASLLLHTTCVRS